LLTPEAISEPRDRLPTIIRGYSVHRRFRYNHWRLGRVPEGASVDANPGAFDSAIAARYGDKATDTINAAEAALNAMPPEGKAWVQNTLKALDAETATWVVGRLASTRAFRP